MIEAELYDGTVLEFPDGTSPEVVQYTARKVTQQRRRQAALPQSLENAAQTPNPTEGMTALDKLLAGTGKAFVDLGRGAGQLAGRVSTQDVRETRRLDAPLMESGAAKFGNFVGNVAATALAMLVPGANTVAGAGLIGGVLGALQPAESMREKAIQTAVGTAGGAVGQKFGQWLGQRAGQAAATRSASAAEAQAANAVRDATIAESRKAGYVLPPATINQGSRAAVAAESLSGKAATHQTAAFRNQTVTNRLIRSDLGLKGARQTSPQELTAVRREAGKVYGRIAKTGRITPDQQYLDEVADLSAVLDDVATEFPGAQAPSGERIKELADSLFQQDFDAGAALKYTRTLREQAKAGFQSVAAKGGDADGLALARARQEAAGALEDMTLRHLRRTGRNDLADAFDKARTTIAKAHDAEIALNPATGNFEAAKLGARLRRGKPMGGNFATVAKFASAFPEAARELKTGPGVSALSAVLSTAAGTGGLVAGNPAIAATAAIPFARAGVRNAILSPLGQRLAAPTYVAPNRLLGLMQQYAPLSAPVGIGLANAE